MGGSADSWLPRRFLRPCRGREDRIRPYGPDRADGARRRDTSLRHLQRSPPRRGGAGSSGDPYLETVRQNSTAHTAATIAAITHSVEPITPTIDRISPTTATTAAPPPTCTRR